MPGDYRCRWHCYPQAAIRSGLDIDVVVFVRQVCRRWPPQCIAPGLSSHRSPFLASFLGEHRILHPCARNQSSHLPHTAQRALARSTRPVTPQITSNTYPLVLMSLRLSLSLALLLHPLAPALRRGARSWRRDGKPLQESSSAPTPPPRPAKRRRHSPITWAASWARSSPSRRAMAAGLAVGLPGDFPELTGNRLARPE